MAERAPIKIENMGGRPDGDIVEFLWNLDDAGLIAQECIQQGALDAVRFLLSHPPERIRAIAVEIEGGLGFYAFLIAEEAARRNLPVVQAGEHTAAPAEPKEGQ